MLNTMNADPCSPTRADIDTVTHFIALLETTSFSPWGTRPDVEAPASVSPDSPWSETTERLNTLLATDPWTRYDYEPEAAGTMIRSPGYIESASLPEVCAMLTWCQRGERFSTGHFPLMLDNGVVLRLLKRVVALSGKL